MAVFVGRVPYWALGWWAGIYVDRMSRRHTIMIASMIGGLLTAIILIAYEVGALSVTLLMIIAFVITLVRSGENLAFTAQLPELVGRSTYLSLLAVMDNTKRIARLVGPLLASALAGILTVAHFYIVVLLAYLTTGFCAYRFEPSVAHHLRQHQGLLPEIKEAMATVRQQRVLLLVNQCFALYAATYAAGLWVLVPRLAGTDLDGGVSGYGLLVAAFGAGGLAGNLLFGHRAFADRGATIMIGMLIVAAGFTVMAAAPNLAVAALAGFFGALGLPLMDMSTAALVHQVCPPNQHGRVLSIHRYFAEVGIAAGLVVGGPIADWLGTRPTLALFGLWVFPVVAFYWVRTRALRAALVDQARDIATASPRPALNVNASERST